MKNLKTWAALSACVAATVTGLARAETPATPANVLEQPVMLDDTATPSRPLMAGLDRLGLAKPLQDLHITVGGYIEASTTFYADRAAGKFQPGRVFDSEDQDPTLNQVSFFVNRDAVVSSTSWDIGGRIEFIYGSDARFIHSTGLFDHYGPADGPQEQFDPVQAYVDVAVPLGNGLLVRAGKFVTPAGVETIDPTTSPLYSRGFLFHFLLPYTHTGVYGTYKVNEAWTVSAGVIRGWDDSLEDKNADGVSVIGNILYSFPDKKQSIAVTAIVGPEYAGDTTHTRSLVDVVYKKQLADNIKVALEGDFIWETDEDGVGPSSHDGYAGGAGAWINWRPGGSQYWAVNARLEYVYDGDGLRVAPGVDNNYYSAAVGLDIQPFAANPVGSNFHIRPEFRYDYAQNSIFGGDNNQLTAAIEAYFAF